MGDVNREFYPRERVVATSFAEAAVMYAQENLPDEWGEYIVCVQCGNGRGKVYYYEVSARVEVEFCAMRIRHRKRKRAKA